MKEETLVLSGSRVGGIKLFFCFYAYIAVWVSSAQNERMCTDMLMWNGMGGRGRPYISEQIGSEANNLYAICQGRLRGCDIIKLEESR